MKGLQKLAFQYASNNKSTGLNNKKIQLKQLIDTYSEHFKNQHQKYEIPLFGQGGLLSYTSRFANTVINLSNLDGNDKKNYFKKIKKSIMSNKTFTPHSCTNLCESLIHLAFQGDQGQIISKMRSYATDNNFLFQKEQVDRFLRAHKFIMAEKANGPIKFIDAKIIKLKNENQYEKARLKFMFQRYAVHQYSLQNLEYKKQVSFMLPVADRVVNVKVKGLNDKKVKVEELDAVAYKILENCKQGKNIVLVQQYLNNLVTQKELGNELLNQYKLYEELGVLSNNLNQSFHSKLQKSLLQKLPNPLSNLHCIKLTNVKYLNYMLEHNLNQTLQQMFGYVKFNIFHMELQKLLLDKNIAKIQVINKLQPYKYLHLFEKDQSDQYHIDRPISVKSKAIIDLITHKKLSSINVYCNSEIILEIVAAMLQHATVKIQQSERILRQNKNAQILLNKLAILSTIYGINIDLANLQQPIKKYKSILHPLTSHLMST